MAYQYHISVFHNSSDTKNASTSNPVATRDAYFIPKGGTSQPANKVLISKGSWTSYEQALPHANFIHTGSFGYCFWDAGKGRIAAVTDQEPTKVQVIYSGSSADNSFLLTVRSDGTIDVTPETSVWVDLKSKGMRNIPGVPDVSASEIKDTIERLLARQNQMKSAVAGLRREYTIGGHKGQAKDFLDKPLFGDNPLRALSLEDPTQFMMSWTLSEGSYENGMDSLLGGQLALEVSHAETATGMFWFRIGVFGTAYNLLRVLRRVADTRVAELKTLFGASWQERLESVQRAGRLYEIDFSMFELLEPSYYNDGGKALVRFNPATLTLLEMTGDKALVPVLIRVWSKGVRPESSEIYASNKSTEGAWLYALQAAKTSVTLYGIWLGHVYHWHLVPAAMVQTWEATFHDDKDHPIYQLLKPHSEWLRVFNYTLLGDYILQEKVNIYDRIAPPTCLGAPEGVLKLADLFSVGRQFFDDDPKTELANNGLEKDNFTKTDPWDGFRVAQNLLRIWEICERFIKAFVSGSYPSDAAVAADTALQYWMKASADTGQGNIRGLPEVKDTNTLTRVLTSLIYRITAHGISRLPRSADPWLTFVANYPPCLQLSDLPRPDDPLSTQQLLKYLPNIGTIGNQLSFYYAFAYSKPYAPLIPGGGSDKDLYFTGGISDPRNVALVTFRNEMQKFVEDYNRLYRPQGFNELPNAQPWLQWPRNIET
jgi:hypothetical protein